MSNNPNKPNTEAAAREALARARAARQILREQEAAHAREKQLAVIRRRAFWKALFYRTCVIYTILNFVYFIAYLVLIYPIKGQPFPDMILGGTSISGHAVFLAAAFLSVLLYSLITYKRQINGARKWKRYFIRVCIWYTALIWLLIAVHGIYFDMIHNPYVGTDAALVLGPSFLLSFCSFGFSLCINLANRIYSIQSIPTAIRAILHLSITLVLATIFFYFLSSGFSTGSDFLVFLVIFATIYAICCILFFALRGAQKRDENDEQEYEAVYMTEELRRKQSAEKTKGKK